ncbi:MAG: prolyl oligopeptidase family serine peptidase [Planctomycetaceae bacterium]
MAEKVKRQYGLWDSPISPQSLAESKRLNTAQWDDDGRTIVWLEGRSGKGVLVAQSGVENAPRDLTSELSVRAGVGYGGGDFTVKNGNVYFAVHRDGRLFRQSLQSGSARPITPKFGSAASPTVSSDGRWLAYVHHDGKETDCIAIVDTEGQFWPQILAGGHDFYMQPRFSADAKKFCFVAWDHPNMPWDGTTLYVADLIDTDGHLPKLAEPRAIAGGADVAIFQPEFTHDGKSILYVSDETGWGRLCKTELQSGESRWLTPEGVEHGWPAWIQDMRTYAVMADGKSVVASRSENMFQRLMQIDLESGAEQFLSGLEEYREFTQLHASPTSRSVVFQASGPRVPNRFVEFDLDSSTSRVIARSSGETVAMSALADCEAISWPTAGNETCHGLFYPPSSERFCGGDGRPPVIALIHGGPTGQATAGWKDNIQFFTTRGYAVLVVNYRGSTGFGREYMLRLRGNWGICDVQDSISGVQFLADSGRIDPQKTVIMGGSAGGFTVLQTLSQYPESFTAGISLYGVANQFHLAAETHKFESHYTDTLVGPLPEAAKLYHARSPEFHADKIIRPLAVFQGEEDKVVPKAQSDAIVAALRRSGTPHIYHCYEGEGHGWRKRETIEHFYRAVDDFLKQHIIYAV